MDERTADDRRTAQARERLESLETSSDEDDDGGGGGLKKTASGGSLFDDLAAWWDDLDMEAWVKTALDDMESLLTGSQTLKQVALCPGADWQVRLRSCSHLRWHAVVPWTNLTHSVRLGYLQPDDARGTCNLCDNPFTFTRRRHHCRCAVYSFCCHLPSLGESRTQQKFTLRLTARVVSAAGIVGSCFATTALIILCI
jgi:hypothetical protein